MESRPDYVDDFIYNEALKTRGLYPERIEKWKKLNAQYI
jgi:hypothetical protein